VLLPDHQLDVQRRVFHMAAPQCTPPNPARFPMGSIKPISSAHCFLPSHRAIHHHALIACPPTASSTKEVLSCMPPIANTATTSTASTSTPPVGTYVRLLHCSRSFPPAPTCSHPIPCIRLAIPPRSPSISLTHTRSGTRYLRSVVYSAVLFRRSL
jgi:hypothetical protein